MTTKIDKSAVIVSGKVITGQQIAGFKSAATSAGANLTIWANACTVQSYSGNNNWSNELFALPTMRLTSGKLSALGKNVLAYMKAHAPLIAYNSATGKIKLADKKANGTAFNYTGTKEPLLTDDGEPSTDFPISFADFLNWSKPKVEKAAPSLKASTVAGQVTKAMDELKAGNFAATADECAVLASQLNELMGIVASLHAKKVEQLPAEEKEVDAKMTMQLLASGQAGKALRAGGKVAPKIAAVA
jgi:hypothetical protein